MSERPRASRGITLYLAAALWNLGLIVVVAIYDGFQTTIRTWPGGLEIAVFLAIVAWLIIVIALHFSRRRLSIGMALIAAALALREGLSELTGGGLSVEVLAVAFLVIGAVLDWREPQRNSVSGTPPPL